MYAGGRPHPLREPCAAILRYVDGGRLDAVTSAEVIQEILHRFVALGRRDLGAEMAAHALDLFAPVLPVTHSAMRRMPELVRRYSALSARDLVHVATCAEEGVEAIISPDRGFDQVSGLERIPPEDGAALARRLR